MVSVQDLAMARYYRYCEVITFPKRPKRKPHPMIFAIKPLNSVAYFYPAAPRAKKLTATGEIT